MPGAFTVQSLAPFLYGATKSSFWRSEAPIATLLYTALVLALVAGRYRWAWLVLVLFDGAGALWWFVHPTHSNIQNAALVVNFATVALLLTPLMRRRLRHPVGLRLRRADT